LNSKLCLLHKLKNSTRHHLSHSLIRPLKHRNLSPIGPAGRQQGNGKSNEYRSLPWHFFLLLLCWVGYIMAFTKFLTTFQIYHTLFHPLHHSTLPHPILGTVSTCVIFPFTYMCTQYLHYIYPSFPPPPVVPTPPNPRQDLFYPPVLQFYKRKKNTTFLFV
jgi:hypothetical protein